MSVKNPKSQEGFLLSRINLIGFRSASKVAPFARYCLIIMLIYGMLGFQTNYVAADFIDQVVASDIFHVEGLMASNIPNYEQANLTSGLNEMTEDALGFSNSIDGNTIVAGAPFEDSNSIGINEDQSNNLEEESGAAYIFTRDLAAWGQPVYLKASNTDPGDEFGYSVAVFGDTVVVGAPFEGSNATGINGDQADNSILKSGAVYVFIRNGASWSQQAYIKASNTGSNYDNFGYSVDIDGDTLVVGAPGDWSSADGINGDQNNNSSPGAGAVFVFTRSGTTWTQQAYIKASNSDRDDDFGASVSISEDTLVVGAPQERSNATGINGDQSDNSVLSAGAAYVFTRSGATWSQQAYIKASQETEFFGFSVSVDGDTMVAGAYKEDGFDGVVYVFRRTGTNWLQEARLKASNYHDDDRFGYDVVVSGDTVAVSSPYESSSGSGIDGYQDDNATIGRVRSGAVYIFTRIGNLWSQKEYIKASDPYEFDKFGWSVDISGESLTVGSQRGGGYFGGTGPGAVYVFAYAPQPIFNDVPFIYWASQYIERLYTAGITGGCGTAPLIYCPESPVTRAQMAIFLLRGIHGSSYSPSNAMGTVFTDVPLGYWADKWIEQLSSEGITSGCASNVYCPDSPVTRAQMAVFLLKSKYGSSYSPPSIGSDTGFSDVPSDYWAAKWVKQLAAEGITSGCAVGIYCPENTVTRAQMAVFLVKAFGLP